MDQGSGISVGVEGPADKFRQWSRCYRCRAFGHRAALLYSVTERRAGSTFFPCHLPIDKGHTFGGRRVTAAEGDRPADREGWIGTLHRAGGVLHYQLWPPPLPTPLSISAVRVTDSERKQSVSCSSYQTRFVFARITAEMPSSSSSSSGTGAGADAAHLSSSRF